MFAIKYPTSDLHFLSILMAYVYAEKIQLTSAIYSVIYHSKVLHNFLCHAVEIQ